MITGVGSRIKELMDYLNTTYNVFAKECGITNYPTIENIVLGKTENIRTTTLNKILKRYPVREEWFLMGKGKMWEKDYFKTRFESMNKRYKSPKEKIDGLVEIFETNHTAFSISTSNSPNAILKISRGTVFSISENIQDKIIQKYPFIPKKFFE